jgi:lipopolysaccharide/colanic/teichoic acid biosynthesis glycosyltransferase
MTSQKGIPRWIEFIVAATGLMILLPFLCVVFALIRLTSRGPGLFKQARVGQGGRVFTFYKFRTMRSGTDGPAVTASGDARVTALGKVLRKTKIDELPGIWNVLLGDISLVGSRPEVPGYVDEKNLLWKDVLLTKPGLTCPTTLMLKNEEKLLADVKEEDRASFYRETLLPYKLLGYIEYEKVRSWKTDFEVIAQTILAVLYIRSTGKKQ